MKYILIFFLIVLAVTTPVFAKNEEKITPASTAAKIREPYFPPYPGILPDNPLYKLKVARDKLVEYLIPDPKRKIDFYLMQTSKQMGMIMPLIKNNKIELAKETALKAEHNFTLLVTVYENNMMIPTSNMYDKLTLATLIHQKTLSDAALRTNGDSAKVFRQVLDMSKRNMKEIDRYIKEIEELKNKNQKKPSPSPTTSK